MGFPLVRLKESDLFIPRRRGSGSRPRRGDSTDDEISDSDGSRRASASSSPARGDGVDYSTSPVGGRGSAQRQSLVVSRNWQVPPQMPSLLQQPLQPNEQGTMPSLSNVQPIETTSESLNAQLQDLLRDMPELVKPVLLQVQTEILQLDGAQRQALLGALPAFAKTATSLKMEIADHNSLLLKFIEKWKDYYGEPSQVAYALHNGIQLLVDEYTVPEGSINVYVYGDLPDHLRATHALAFFKSTLAAAGATLVTEPARATCAICVSPLKVDCHIEEIDPKFLTLISVVHHLVTLDWFYATANATANTGSINFDDPDVKVDTSEFNEKYVHDLDKIMDENQRGVAKPLVGYGVCLLGYDSPNATETFRAEARLRNTELEQIVTSAGGIYFASVQEAANNSMPQGTIVVCPGLNSINDSDLPAGTPYYKMCWANLIDVILRHETIDHISDYVPPVAPANPQPNVPPAAPASRQPPQAMETATQFQFSGPEVPLSVIRTLLICLRGTPENDQAMRATMQSFLQSIIANAPGELERVVSLLSEDVVGEGRTFVRKALTDIFDITEDKIRWMIDQEDGDLEEVAETLKSNHHLASFSKLEKLTVKRVLSTLRSISEETGYGSQRRKIGKVRKLMVNAELGDPTLIVLFLLRGSLMKTLGVPQLAALLHDTLRSRQTNSSVVSQPMAPANQQPALAAASAPQYDNTLQIPAPNVSHPPDTHTSQLNNSASPFHAPTQASAPPPLDATAPTSGAPIEPDTGMGAALAPVLDEKDLKQQELRDWLEDKDVDPVLSELCLKRFSSLDFFLGHANIDLVKVLPELSSMPSNTKLSLVAAIKDETLRQTGSRRGGVSLVPAFEIRRKGSETWKRYASAAKARDDHFGIFDAATLADLRPYDRSSCCNGLRTILNENKRDSEWFSREFDVREVHNPPVVRNYLLFECTYGGTSQDCPFGPQGPDAFAPYKGQRFCVISLL